jgi:DNA-binding NarL/FixJ family response regulator
MEKVKVFIVDDHPMFRDGLRFLLSKNEKYEVIGEAENGVEFLEKIEMQLPDIVLMDISMPEMDGIQATKEVMKTHPELKVLALSMFGEEEYYYKMIHAGVSGFILKESGSVDLEQGITEVLNGGNYFSSELLQNVIPKFGAPEKANPETNDIDFTENEMEILKMICNGASGHEISKKMNMELSSVELTTSSLLEKTNVGSTVDLIMFAIKNNIIEI